MKNDDTKNNYNNKIGRDTNNLSCRTENGRSAVADLLISAAPPAVCRVANLRPKYAGISVPKLFCTGAPANWSLCLGHTERACFCVPPTGMVCRAHRLLWQHALVEGL